MKEGRLWGHDYDENVKLASSYYKGLSQLSVVLFLFYTMRIRDRWQITSPSRHSHNTSILPTVSPNLVVSTLYIYACRYLSLQSLQEVNQSPPEESKTTTTTEHIDNVSRYLA